jgi:hypothetical protein
MKNFIINTVVFLRILNSLAGITFFIALISGGVFLGMNWQKLTTISMSHCAGIISKESELMHEWERLADEKAKVQVALNSCEIKTCTKIKK